MGLIGVARLQGNLRIRACELQVAPFVGTLSCSNRSSILKKLS